MCVLPVALTPSRYTKVYREDFPGKEFCVHMVDTSAGVLLSTMVKMRLLKSMRLEVNVRSSSGSLAFWEEAVKSAPSEEPGGQFSSVLGRFLKAGPLICSPGFVDYID